MRGQHLVLASLLLVVLPITSVAAPFAMFPKAGRVVSPDGRFEIRDVDRVDIPGELVGNPRSLWVTDLATGRSRKLCDYFGVAAVAWEPGNSIIVTQYVAKKTSRAFIFTSAMGGEAYVLDAPALISLVTVELRPMLRENDHLFVEASSLDGDILRFRVWGYGKHDPNGFRWNCTYAVSNGAVLCQNAPAGH